MEEEDSGMDHPKKRRRRRKSRDPLSATLILTNEVKGELGVVSKDLFDDLFGSRCIPFQNREGSQEEICYAAISSWSPVGLDQIDEVSWTIIPVRPQKPEWDGPASISDLQHSCGGITKQECSKARC